MTSAGGSEARGREAAGAQQDATKAGTGWRETYLGGSAEAEGRLFARFAHQIGQIQDNVRKRDGALAVRRAFHAKIVAGVRNAELRVLPDIPSQYQVGPFQSGATFPASVRFSNASGSIVADGQKDLRGLAFRITLPGGKVHDFLATNAPASHARDARQFMVAASASASPSRLRVIPALLRGLGPLETVRLLRVVMKSSRKVDSLATERYWSRAPITWGRYAVRYVLSPTPGSAQARPDVDQSSPDFLNADLAERLRQGPVSFDLQLQCYVNDALTPIEDASKAWLDRDAPPVTIARLVIPQTDLSSDEAMRAQAEGDLMEFNPWNAGEEFRPLGSQNRARKEVYAASARNRSVGAMRAPSAVNAGSDGMLGRIFWAITSPLFKALNLLVPWHRLPPLLGIFNLGVYREELRQKNLYDTYLEGPPSQELPKDAPPFEHRFLKTRTSDGFYNDLNDMGMGARGRRFGRNMPLQYTFPDPEPILLKPSPREVSNRLLKRERFIPATTLNLLAGAWIQFQIHDWFAHEQADGSEGEFEIPLLDGDPWTSKPMRVPRTASDKTRTPEEAHRPPTFINCESHWWDGSQIYGSDEAATRKLRSGKEGKLTIDEERFLLPLDPLTGIPRTGFNDNWWVGLALLHTLFTREHNAICDRLRADHPYWADDQIFDTARMINTALMAKIHTVDWTPGILSHPTLQAGMNANWWGLQTRTLHRIFGRISDSEAIGGIPGSATDHHAAPYSLTEEFTSVYRLHPLMPDEIEFHAVKDGSPIKTLTFMETAFAEAQKVFDDGISMADAFYSFGIAHPGAITLHNFPEFMRDLHLPDGQHLDLAAVDVLRDRERGVPRYNTFRRLLRRGAVRSFDEITSNKRWANELREVYEGDVNRVDLMVGMYAEDLPKGFGFSDTAFRIFILMASRRMKSDRFFTVDYTPEVYTPAGLEWIASNTMTTVLLRHHPELAPTLRHVKNAFAPWQRLGHL